MPNKNEITPPAPLPRPAPLSVGVHAPYADPLGAEAVQLEDVRQYQLLEGGQLLDSARRGEQIAATKRTPAEYHSGLRRTLDRQVGRVMTESEVQLVGDIHVNRELGQRFQVKGEIKTGAVEEKLKNVRARLRELTPQQSDKLDRYMHETAAPFFQNNKEDGELVKNDSWANWLSGSNDDHLMNFLQWHNHLLASQRHSPELQEEVELQRAMYKKDIASGIEEGWLSKSAQAATEKVEGIDVLIGDQFDTILQDRAGYHFRGTRRVAISQGAGGTYETRVKDARNNINNTLPHELNHAVLATAANRKHSPLAERWIDEALTEHISAVMFHGDPDVVKPAEREHDQFVYDAERQLLDFLLNNGSKRVDPALATRAYSGNTYEQQNFYDALNSAWGTEVLPMVSDKVTEYELLGDDPLSTENLTAAVLSVLEDLQDDPRRVFGRSYRWPRRSKLVGAGSR